MILLLITLAYVSFGLYVGAWSDEREMSKPVPYGEFPSIVSLREWRLLSYTIFLFGGVPIAIYGIIERMIERRANGFFQ